MTGPRIEHVSHWLNFVYPMNNIRSFTEFKLLRAATRVGRHSAPSVLHAVPFEYAHGQMRSIQAVDLKNVVHLPTE